jgi:pimeloyl-ACP methyl ester carboxylesterase
VANTGPGGGISSADFNALANPIMAAVLREPKNKQIEKFKEELRKIDPALQPAFESFGLWVLELGRLPAEEEPVGEEPTDAKPKWSRSKKVGLAIAVVLGLGFAAARFAPDIWRLSHRNHDVQVPVSHFVKESGTSKKLIVFVHGVIGDMDNTWVNPATHASWPELIKSDPDLGDFDVYVYGYSSPALGTASDINEIAERFRQQLKDWKFFTKYDELDFITHSMGGIITKRMLNTLNTPAEVPNLRRVHCVIYIAVPSNGAKSADLASWISQNPQFRSMSPEHAADFLQGAERDWAALLRERPNSSPFPRTYSAYETLSTAEFRVVPQLYVSELSDGPLIGFDYNHIDIVKPRDQNSDVYVWARARLLESSQYQGQPK